MNGATVCEFYLSFVRSFIFFTKLTKQICDIWCYFWSWNYLNKKQEFLNSYTCIGWFIVVNVVFATDFLKALFLCCFCYSLQMRFKSLTNVYYRLQLVNYLVLLLVLRIQFLWKQKKELNKMLFFDNREQPFCHSKWEKTISLCLFVPMLIFFYLALIGWRTKIDD